MSRVAYDATGLPPERPIDSADRILDRGAQEALALLASLSVDQLRAGLEKGRSELAFVEAMDVLDHERMQEDIGHPGRHPSRSYESWLHNASETRRRQLHVAIRDVRQELERRGETSSEGQ